MTRTKSSPAGAGSLWATACSLALIWAPLWLRRQQCTKGGRNGDKMKVIRMITPKTDPNRKEAYEPLTSATNGTELHSGMLLRSTTHEQEKKLKHHDLRLQTCSTWRKKQKGIKTTTKTSAHFQDQILQMNCTLLLLILIFFDIDALAISAPELASLKRLLEFMKRLGNDQEKQTEIRTTAPVDLRQNETEKEKNRRNKKKDTKVPLSTQ